MPRLRLFLIAAVASTLIRAEQVVDRQSRAHHFAIILKIFARSGISSGERESSCERRRAQVKYTGLAWKVFCCPQSRGLK